MWKCHTQADGGLCDLPCPQMPVKDGRASLIYANEFRVEHVLLTSHFRFIQYVDANV